MKQKKEKRILKRDVEQYKPYIDAMLKEGISIAAIMVKKVSNSKSFSIRPLKKYKDGHCNFGTWADVAGYSFNLKAAIQMLYNSQAHYIVNVTPRCVIDLHNDKVYYNGSQFVSIVNVTKEHKLQARKEKLKHTIISI